MVESSKIPLPSFYYYALVRPAGNFQIDPIIRPSANFGLNAIPLKYVSTVWATISEDSGYPLWVRFIQERWIDGVRFMADWLTDDANHGVIEDPDSLQFMKDVLAALKSFQEDKDKTTAKSTALSIAAKINSVPETKAQYVLQKYHAVLSGAAASNSPLDPSDLVEITYWFTQELSPQLAE